MDFFTGAGRVGRLKHVGISLGLGVVNVVLLFAMASTDPLTGEATIPASYLLVGLGFGWLGWANSIRRVHDLGRSGWFTLWTLVPLAGLVAALYIMFMPGDPNSNPYGPSPKAGSARTIAKHKAELARLEAHVAQSAPAQDPYLNSDGSYDMNALFK